MAVVDGLCLLFVVRDGASPWSPQGPLPCALWAVSVPPSLTGGEVTALSQPQYAFEPGVYSGPNAVDGQEWWIGHCQ